jgi:hypothetical protein
MSFREYISVVILSTSRLQLNYIGNKHHFLGVGGQSPHARQNSELYCHVMACKLFFTYK